MTQRDLSTKLLLFVLVFSLCLSACTQTQTPSPSQAAPSHTAETSPSPEPPPDPVAEQLKVMTVEEKVGQLLVAGIEGYAPGEDAKTAIRDVKVGGIILFKRNVKSAEQLSALNNTLKALNDGHIPLFLCVDEEGGLVSRMPPEITDLPSAFTFGSVEDADARSAACGELGAVLGSLCSSFGFNMNFAPVMDVWSNPGNTVIGTRAFSTDSAVVSHCALRAAQGLTASGVIPVGKHFPGHGDTLVDSHVGLPVVDKMAEDLEQLELIPFRSAIEADSPAIMIAHILMTQIDPTRPASLSHPVVTGLLREELGFEGVVCTDDLTMAAISDTYGMGEAAVLAVEAGCDLLLVCHGESNLLEARNALLDAVKDGRISQTQLDESVYRILTLKANYELTNDPIPTPDTAVLNQKAAKLLEMLHS